MSRCVIDMTEFPEPFYYPVQMTVTYGKPYWPSYSVWLVDPKHGQVFHSDAFGQWWSTPGGDV